MSGKRSPDEDDEPLAQLDVGVRSFVDGRGERSGRLSVIVEARVPIKARFIGRAIRPQQSQAPPVRARTVPKRPPQLDAVGRALRRFLLPKPPVRLNIADAFVAELSPAQIRTLAKNPAVRAIRENRMHRVAG